jgi:hypothetical protein
LEWPNDRSLKSGAASAEREKRENKGKKEEKKNRMSQE